MFDRFTDHARTAMGYAHREAGLLCLDYLGTEHMLVGVVQVINSTAATVLRSEDVDLARVRAKVAEFVPHGATLETMGQFPFTPGGKTALDFSLQAADRFGDDFIGTAHLLLGLIREDGTAARVLEALGVDLVRVSEALGADPRLAPSELPFRAERTDIARLRADIRDLQRRVDRLESGS